MATSSKMKMPIKAIAPWFGGKRTMAARIHAELGDYCQLFVPFCGGLGDLLSWPPVRQETINDLHGDVINLARVVAERDSAEALYDRLCRALVCEASLEEARLRLENLRQVQLDYRAPLPAIERAYWYFLASWMGRNGTSGTARTDYQIAARWTKGGGSPTKRWASAVESLPAWHVRLKHVVILNRDAFEIIPKFEDSPDTAIYCDPPYLADTRGVSKNGRGGRYLHEFNHNGGADLFSDGDDHQRLRYLLDDFQFARIVVSYYDHPRIRQLYDGWTFVACTTHKNLSAQNRRGSVKSEAPEVLITNGPSFTAGEAK